MNASEDDITLLINGCKQNDRKCQEHLYRKFYSAMAAICMRYTRNQQDAIEVLNDAFLKVFRNIQQYDAEKASLYTWIRRIITNTAIDFLRRQMLVFSVFEFEESEEPGIHADIIQKIQADALLAMIRRLPAATQLVFNLHAIEGFSHGEIAAQLQISESTSRWHVSEARKQLKELVQLERAQP